MSATGEFLVDGGGCFGLVPKLIWQELRPPDELNRFPFALNSLLILSEGQTIVVDTGYGTRLTDKQSQIIGLQRPDGDLLADLERHNVRANDVDIVINTHLHGDHCAGNTRFDDGKIVPTFPTAKYMIQRLEWADAVTPNERTRATYMLDNYLPLFGTEQLVMMNGNTTITGEVSTAIARGHTRAQQMVIIRSQGETALFVADMASLHYHLERLAWVASYDVEPLESIETKRFWQQWIVENDALVIFQHDTEVTAGRLRPNGRHFKVEPVELND